MNVLVLKPDHLGDFALALPSLWEVKQKIGKESRLDILASPANAEWATMLDWINRIIPVQHPRYLRPQKKFAPLALPHMLVKGLSLRSQKYDYAVELTSAVNDPWGKILLLSSGALRRCGPHGSYDFLLTEKHFISDGHQSERLAARFPRDWQISGKASPREFMPPYLRWENQKHENLVLLSPWAGTQAKEWLPERWREIFQTLVKNFGVKILAPQDRMKETRFLFHERPDCIASVDSISDSLRWLCRARLVITVDSATAHFAWLTGTPLVQLFSGTTEPARWASLETIARLEAFPVCYPCHLENCNQPQHYCMQDISAERILQAAQKVLV